MMVNGSDTNSNLGGRVERDYQRYSQLLKLWSQENAIKTQKLQYFLLTNALLVIGYTLTSKETESAAMFCAIGATLSLIWMLSLGRTILFQKRWQALMAQLSAQYESDSRISNTNYETVNGTASIDYAFGGRCVVEILSDWRPGARNSFLDVVF